MRTLYIECNMGAAGDMLMAGLLELLPDPAPFLDTMNSLGLPQTVITRQDAVKCGIQGTQVSVTIGGREEESLEAGHGHSHKAHHGQQADHGHWGLTEVAALLDSLPLSDGVRQSALGVYTHIAEAESAVHGRPVDTAHFHEVGALDAVADVVGVCLLMEMLAPQRVLVSPINVGSGQVHCAHGILPVPAPATARILQGVPAYSNHIRGELCTPTGAALLRHFAHEFGDMPVMETQAIGYGMGKKDFEAANCVRVFLGETRQAADQVVEITCNLDDMTGEAMGFALELLLEQGALDVCLVPIQMKKSRPGQMLVCLCKSDDERRMAELILRHTTSFGVRCKVCQRYVLERSFADRETAYGPVRVKRGAGFGVVKEKVEYEDVARLARERGVGLGDVLG